MQKIKSGLKQKRWSVGIGIFFVIISLSGCLKDNDKEVNDNMTDTEQDSTSIYLIAMDGSVLDDDLDAQSVGCNDNLVEVKIQKKLSPQEALEALFTYVDHKEENGLYNVFSLSPNLKIEKMIVANDFAIVTLSEDLVTGGMCDDPRVPAQIRETLMQFDEIDGVDIFVGDEEVNSYLSEKDDYDTMEFNNIDTK